MVLNSKWFKYTKVNQENGLTKKEIQECRIFDVHSKNYFQSLIKNLIKSKNSFIKDNFSVKELIQIKKKTKNFSY